MNIDMSHPHCQPGTLNEGAPDGYLESLSEKSDNETSECNCDERHLCDQEVTEG